MQTTTDKDKKKNKGGAPPAPAADDNVDAAFGAGQAPKDEAPSGAGWEDVEAPDVEGWYKCEQGSVISGQIVDRMLLRQDNGWRHALLVKVNRPIMAQVPRSDEMREFPEGSIIGLGVRHRLRKLLFYVKHKGAIWVRAEGKKQLRGRQTLWEFTIRANGKKARPDPIAMDIDKLDDVSSDDGDSDFDSIPF